MSDVLVNLDGDLLILTLNRPDKLNAMSDDMRGLLLHELSAQLKAPTARAILITGNGPGFCSGADLDLETIFARRPVIENQILAGVNQLVRLLRELPVPVIAAVNGAAAGAGFSLALACDIIMASPSAKFHLSFARIGAALDGGASSMLTHRIGAGRTTALAMLGGNLDAQTAHDLGLVYKLVDGDVLQEEATALAKRLASGPTLALGLIKREISTAQYSTLDEALRLEAACQGRAFASDDFEEGVRAFSENRKPQFSGK